MLPPKGIVLPRDDMDVGLSPRDLCADMAAYPHKAAAAAQGSAHVELSCRALACGKRRPPLGNAESLFGNARRAHCGTGPHHPASHRIS